MVDYQSQRVSSVQLSMLLSLDRHLYCWTISHREYHSSSSQCYYHWIDTSAGGLLVTESIIRPVVSVSITGSTPLLVDYQSQRVSTDQFSVLLPLDRHLCWWIISHREYHPSSSQCFYHWIDTSAGGLLVTESIIRPVVSFTTTGSTPLLLDCQSQRVSSIQLSVLLPLDRHLCCWTVSHRECHPSSCQCYYHWIDTSAGGLLVTKRIILPVVSVSITGSTPLLVDYQSQIVASLQLSVLLPLDRHLCWWTVSHREYHSSNCQCYYHWIDTSAVGLLVTESVIHPVVSVTTTGSTPLLLDYQSQKVSFFQQSVFLSLDRHLCWWTISHREYHPSSCQCYYHWIDTSAGELLVTESIIRPVVSGSITGSTPLLLNYQSQRVSFVQQSVLLSLDRYLCWWTISHREYHPSSCQCYYHWIDTSAGGLLVTESIIRPVVSVTTTGSTPLLVNYQSQRVSSVQQSVFLSLDRHLCWWTISHREYHPSSCQCYYHWIDTSAGGLLVTESIIRPVVSVTTTGSTPLLVNYQSQRVSFVQLSVLLPLDRHLCWWTISHREYHPSCCQCFYHGVDTSAGGLLVTESINRPVFSVTTTGSTPLLVEYQSQRVSSVQQSMFLSLDRHLCRWTISHREYHSSSCQFYYHWIDTSAVGLLVTESVIHPVVSFTTTGSTPLLLDCQSQRVSSIQLSVLLPLDRHLCWWTISHKKNHSSSSQCFYHWIDTSAGGLLVTDSSIPLVVSVTTTGSTPLLVDCQSQRVSFVQQSVFLSLDRHLCWWTISHREYHRSSCQCYYYWIDTSTVGLLVTESVTRPVVSVTITESTPLLLDYQSQRVPPVLLSVLLSLDRHLCWWTISHREYHPSSSQCFYQWIDTSDGGLLVTESIIRPVVSVSITGSTPLLVDYQSQRVSSVQQSVLLPLVRHLCWWTISHREYHSSSSQCFYHWIDTSAVGLLVTEGIIRPVVSVSINGSTPLMVDYQSQRVSSVQLSMFLSLDRHLYCWTISHREYHSSSSQCYYHWIDTSAGGLLVTESIIVQLSILLSLDRHLSCWTISHRECHSSSCQCYYHWIDTSAGGLLVTESIIRPVVSVTTTGSTPLLMNYQSQRVSFVQLSVLLPLDRHLCWWTISHREYHPSCCQCFYHGVDTSAGGLLVTESINRPVFSVTTTGSTPLLVDYQSQRVSSVQQSMFLSLDRHLCRWTISHREYHPSSCQFYYHWIDTSAVGLLVTESVIHPVVSFTTTGSTPLLLDCQSQRVSSIQLSVLLPLDRHPCWWTISHKKNHSSSSQCFYHWIDTSAGGLLVTDSSIPLVGSVTTTGSTPLLVDCQSQRVSFVQQSVFLSLDRHLCWWTISHREYHRSSCQCYYYWIDTPTVGLLVTESVTRPVVSVTITESTPLLLDYQSQRVPSVLLSVLLSLDRHLCWWTISHREYHPSSSQCFYQWIDTSDGGLLVTESIIRPVVSVSITGSTHLLVDYQSQRVSSVQQSVLLPLVRHLCW